MADANIEILKKKTYLKTIENSVGSKMFNSVFVKYKDTNEVKDVLNDGEYSCAFFVSSLLFLFQVVDRPVSTVKSLKELIDKNSDWKKVSVDTSENGDVIFWNKLKHDDGTETAHVGFIINKEEAISTDYKIKMVSRHSLKDREVDVIYRYSW